MAKEQKTKKKNEKQVKCPKQKPQQQQRTPPIYPFILYFFAFSTSFSCFFGKNVFI